MVMQIDMMKRLEMLPGKISFYFENLDTGESIGYRENEPMMAASVIKLFVMASVFEGVERNTFRMDKIFEIKREECVPSCGALTYLHDHIQVTLMDLVTLMIIFSDNSATNVLIDFIGLDVINCTITGLGFEKTALNRKMFDLEKTRLGIQNYITACETGRLLKMMYEGTLVSRQASDTMLSIMKNQQLAGKIPFYLKAIVKRPEIAHKTGEDIGISHDVGIIYGKVPYIVCFCGNETDTPRLERLMADISLELYQELNK
jgi:beta-lactamase class A